MKSCHKVLFLCKSQQTSGGGYGQHLSSGLYNSARFVQDMLVENGMESKTVTVVDANKIDAEVSKFMPHRVILEAIWVTPDKLRELQKLHPHIIWYVRVHSELPFLANEGQALGWLFEYAKLGRHVHIAANSDRAAKELSGLLHCPVLWLPNYYPVDMCYHGFKTPARHVVDVGCFGAIRPMKNHLLQAVAAVKFAGELGKKLRFHVNSGRVEMHGNPVLKNLRSMFIALPHHVLVEHPWKEHSAFQEVVRTMDVGMQCSFTETFSIVGADMVNANVPVVVSPELRWVNKMFQVAPNNFTGMVDRLHLAYDNASIAIINKTNLWEASQAAKDIWLDYFKG